MKRMPRAFGGRGRSAKTRQAVLDIVAKRIERDKKTCDQSPRFKNVRLARVPTYQELVDLGT